MSTRKQPVDTFDAILAQHTRMQAATQAAIDAPATATEQGQAPSELRFGDVGPSSGSVGALRLCPSCKGPCVYRTRCPDCGDHLCYGECQIPEGCCQGCGIEGSVHDVHSQCPLSEWRDYDPREHERRTKKGVRHAA